MPNLGVNAAADTVQLVVTELVTSVNRFLVKLKGTWAPDVVPFLVIRLDLVLKDLVDGTHSHEVVLVHLSLVGVLLSASNDILVEPLHHVAALGVSVLNAHARATSRPLDTGLPHVILDHHIVTTIDRAVGANGLRLEAT